MSEVIHAYANSELKQVTFLTTRTPTGSKVDVFHQSNRLLASKFYNKHS